jgi:ABC-2 type transport system ATP-binding protein
VIDFFDYHKKYGAHEVLSIPELTISGGVHWIKGVNGSGKSTLLKSISGIIPFEGDININGLNVKRNPVLSRRQVAYSEAEPVYPAFLTAMEIIDFVTQVRDIRETEKDAILKYFGVNDFRNQATGGYSTGMLKKLSLCMAFAGKVPWVLLDEPFAFIDHETEENLIKLINTRSREGINFIITSHHELNHDQIKFDNIFSIENARINCIL